MLSGHLREKSFRPCPCAEDDPEGTPDNGGTTAYKWFVFHDDSCDRRKQSPGVRTAQFILASEPSSKIRDTSEGEMDTPTMLLGLILKECLVNRTLIEGSA